MAETRIVTNRNGGTVIASPEQAVIARRGKVERRRMRIEAAEVKAREALRNMLDRMPPEQVKAYAVREGKEYLAAWGVICEEQAFLAAESADTRAAQFIGKAAGLLPDVRDTAKAVPLNDGRLPGPGSNEMAELLAAWRAACAADPALAERARILLEGSSDRNQPK